MRERNRDRRQSSFRMEVIAMIWERESVVWIEGKSMGWASKEWSRHWTMMWRRARENEGWNDQHVIIVVDDERRQSERGCCRCSFSFDTNHWHKILHKSFERQAWYRSKRLILTVQSQQGVGYCVHVSNFARLQWIIIRSVDICHDESKEKHAWVSLVRG